MLNIYYICNSTTIDPIIYIKKSTRKKIPYNFYKKGTRSLIAFIIKEVNSASFFIITGSIVDILTLYFL